MNLRINRSVLTLVTLLTFAGNAYAQNHEIPYQGHLDLDGTPMNGEFDFWFELYTTPTGGGCDADTPPATDCIWSEEKIAVDVAAGAFSVTLGEMTSLDDVIWQNPDLYLGIRVASTGDAYTKLAGRQRILAVPMAADAAGAKNFNVTGVLNVTGATNPHAILPKYQAYNSQGSGDGGAAIYNDSSATYKSLMIVGNASGGGTNIDGGTLRRVGVWDDLFVNGTITARGHVKGSGVSVLYCSGGNYSCSPTQCITTCMNAGLRMATVDDAYAWAAAGGNMCAYVWMLDNTHLGNPCFGYAMYTSQATGGCGPVGTGNIPRMVDMNHGFTWNEASQKANCACAPLR